MSFNRTEYSIAMRNFSIVVCGIMPISLVLGYVGVVYLFESVIGVKMDTVGRMFIGLGQVAFCAEVAYFYYRTLKRRYKQKEDKQNRTISIWSWGLLIKSEL